MATNFYNYTYLQHSSECLTLEYYSGLLASIAQEHVDTKYTTFINQAPEMKILRTSFVVSKL